MCQKSKNTKMEFVYSKLEYKKLLKKFKGSVPKLNKYVQSNIPEYIAKNKNTSYDKVKKKVYLSAETNDIISTFCISKNINRAELAALIKQDIL
jgi:hypothetical protein